MRNLQDILKSFAPISLKEMDSVKLMDRTDTKFTFSEGQLYDVLNQVRSDYKVLEIETLRQSVYKTLYYDTDNLNLYLQHHSGRLNRYKIRHRTYIDSNTGYLEVKFKSNKGRTIKERIKKNFTPLNWEQETIEFLNSKLPFDPATLKPVLWVNYKRITLVSNNLSERVTIDVDLEFVSGNVVRKMVNLVIAEVKQDKKNASLFLLKMKELHIREGSISKYCLGIALTKAAVKRNNFKEKILALKHIVYDPQFNLAGC